jgi:DNA-binding transcriptional ArsR family regulator
MSLTSCQTSFREGILNFLWRQWGQLGVSAPVAFADAWCQDPEALLVFTLEAARHEPRMFDEVLDWLAEHGQALMSQRMKALFVRDPDAPQALVDAALARTGVAKAVPRTDAPVAAVFPLLDALVARPEDADPVFLAQGFIRPPFTRSGKTRSVIPEKPVALVFKLRAAFGATARAEALRFLALRGAEAGTSDVADAALMTRYGLQQALDGLTRARLVRRRQKGSRDLAWSIEDGPMLAWLKGAEGQLPAWVGWPSVFQGLALLWRWLLDPRREGESAYLRASGARATMRLASPLLQGQGLVWRAQDPGDYRGEAYWEVFVADITSLVEVLQRAEPSEAKRYATVAEQRLKDAGLLGAPSPRTEGAADG